VSHKIFGEDLRSKISNWEWRIGTSEAKSVLPIWLLCWVYQNRRYYRGRVGKTAKGSLARQRVVTGLTGGRHGLTSGARLQPVGQQWKYPLFYPSSFSLLHYSPGLTPPNHGGPSLFPSFTSLNIHGDLKFQTREGIKIGSKRISQGPSSHSPSSSLDSSWVLLSKGIQIFVLPDLLTWCKDLNFPW
jgi:hypothetical protein